MRDYKNVKVPNKYRSKTTHGSVKRAETGRGARRQAKPGRVKTSIMHFFSLAVFAACIWLGREAYLFITRAELFRVSGVDISGVRQLAEADLKKIAGEFTGQNIFRTDLNAGVRMARTNPWIKDVRICRSLPNRIAIDVIERIPYAIVSTQAGRYLMDKEGVVIERSSGRAHSLPRIEARGFQAVPGEAAASESIADALSLLAEIEALGGWDPGKLVVKAGSPEAISLLYEDREFRVGSGNYSEKLRRLAEITADVQRRGLHITYLDVRAERQAAAMVSKGKSQNGRQRSRRAQR